MFLILSYNYKVTVLPVASLHALAAASQLYPAKIHFVDVSTVLVVVPIVVLKTLPNFIKANAAAITTTTTKITN